MGRLTWILISFLQLGIISQVSAHESQPGTLDITQLTDTRYEVVWNAPIYYGQPHPAILLLPGDWKNVVDSTERRLVDSIVFRHLVETSSTINGSIVRFPGLESTITDVYVRLNRLDDTTMTSVVRPTKPFIELRGSRAWYVSAAEYIALGFYHILVGVDHLLFVLGLLFIVHSRGMLVKTITSFTCA